METIKTKTQPLTTNMKTKRQILLLHPYPLPPWLPHLPPLIRSGWHLSLTALPGSTMVGVTARAVLCEPNMGIPCREPARLPAKILSPTINKAFVAPGPRVAGQ